MVKKPNLKNTMVVPLLLGVLMLVGFALSPAYGQATTTTETTSEPFFDAFFSCVNGRNGELVEISGTVYSVIHVTLDDRGGFHFVRHANLVASGTGLDSGTQYPINSVSNSEGNGMVGTENTFVETFSIISKGPLNNFVLRHNFHITVTPDGEFTGFVDHGVVECR